MATRRRLCFLARKSLFGHAAFRWLIRSLNAVPIDQEGIGIEGLRGEVDADAVAKAWDRVLAAPNYDGPPVWFHGDLSYLNLLAHHGKLAAVIDWGTCGVGDPAIDCLPAWRLFPPAARAVYRDALGVDDATWERARGWVLQGVYGIAYYRDTNPVLAGDLIRGIEALLAE